MIPHDDPARCMQTHSIFLLMHRELLVSYILRISFQMCILYCSLFQKISVLTSFFLLRNLCSWQHNRSCIHLHAIQIQWYVYGISNKFVFVVWCLYHLLTFILFFVIQTLFYANFFNFQNLKRIIDEAKAQSPYWSTFHGSGKPAGSH